MAIVNSFIRDKINMTLPGDRGLKSRVEFMQSIKYTNDLYNRIRALVDDIQNSPDTGYGELTLLSDKYGTDKGSYQNIASDKVHPYSWLPHSYTDIYEVLFRDIRYDVKNVFECGIGSIDETIEDNMSKSGVPGASLRMWRDYFPSAEIYGADIDKKCLFEEERIHTCWIDQTLPEAVNDCFSRINKEFDVIIDDGLHKAEAAICLFDNSINYLKEDGIYVIEDLSTQDIYKLQQHFSDKRQYSVKYAIMETLSNINNNLIIVKKVKSSD